MPICRMCEAIPPSLFEGSTSNFHVHHPSLKSLESSAKDGCNICSLLHDTIVNSRYKYAHPCGGTAGSDFLEKIESTYTYAGLPQNVASKDGHRTYLQINKFKGKPCAGWIYALSYQVGRRGFEHRFDIEFSDDPGSTTLHSLSEVTFSVARSWIEKCLHGHENCNIRYDTKFMPTRLIDVDKQGTTPRLIETASSVLEDTRYLALSHRWGPSMPEQATTKTSTLARRLSRIPMSTLPTTFREAIITTRRLHLRYLWIDSLCILQDSPDDWQKESALMGKVYSHSHCMIAAAAASDCFGGLFARKAELPIIKAPTEDSTSSKLRSALIKPRFASWDDLFKTCKLNGRGWTLQERELSPRILYFTKHTMMFECREAQAGDPSGPGSMTSSSLRPKISTVITQGAHRSLDQVLQMSMASAHFATLLPMRYLVWMEMVEGYSERKLSMSSDKFAGVSGLASEFTYLLDDQYVAGLWRKDIRRGLCWRWKQNDITHTATMKKLKVEAMNYGPSWSWAKMVVPISYDLIYNQEREMAPMVEGSDNDIDWGASWDPKIINVTTVPEGKDPNGTLISATIHLEGFIFRVSRSRTGNLQILGEAVRVVWDFLPQTATTYYILSLGSTGVGLVLIRNEINDFQYRRAGIISSIQREWFKDSDLQKLALI